MQTEYKIPSISLLEEVIDAKKEYAKINTIKYYVATVAKLKDYLGDKPDTVLDYEVCKGFAGYLCDNLKESSARAYLQQLAALFNDAKERGWIERTPIPKPAALMPKRNVAEKGSLTIEELMRLYQATDVRTSTRRAFLFSCFTGLSLADIETIEFDHIHHDGHRLVIVKPLEHSTTQIPLGQMAMRILNEIEVDYQPSNNNRIFQLMDRSTITNDLRKWTQMAHIEKNVTFSYGKNTFCALALQAGIDINKLARWNGSAVQSVESNSKYALPPNVSSMGAFDRLFA